MARRRSARITHDLVDVNVQCRVFFGEQFELWKRIENLGEQENLLDIKQLAPQGRSTNSVNLSVLTCWAKHLLDIHGASCTKCNSKTGCDADQVIQSQDQGSATRLQYHPGVGITETKDRPKEVEDDELGDGVTLSDEEEHMDKTYTSNEEQDGENMSKSPLGTPLVCEEVDDACDNKENEDKQIQSIQVDKDDENMANNCEKDVKKEEEEVFFLQDDHGETSSKILCKTTQNEQKSRTERFKTDSAGHECPICCKIFKRKNMLKCHVRTHTKTYPFTCEICCKGFVAEPNLKAHKETHDERSVFSCSKCDKQFRRKSYLKAHSMVHTGLKPYLCGVCGKAFAASSSLKKHKVMHEYIEGSSLCPDCGKTFRHKEHLRRHMRYAHINHEKLTEKRHACSHCGKLFLKPSLLKRHEMVHTGEKDHFCNTCGKGYRSSVLLKEHLTVHTGVKLHNCSTCDWNFTHRSSLSKHKKRCTNKVTETEGSRSQFIIAEESFMILQLADGDSDIVEVKTEEHGDSDTVEVTTEEHIVQKIDQDTNGGEVHFVEHGEAYLCQLCHAIYQDSSLFTLHMQEKHPEYHTQS